MLSLCTAMHRSDFKLVHHLELIFNVIGVIWFLYQMAVFAFD